MITKIKTKNKNKMKTKNTQIYNIFLYFLSCKIVELYVKISDYILEVIDILPSYHGLILYSEACLKWTILRPIFLFGLDRCFNYTG
jgi:hypothetical protein